MNILYENYGMNCMVMLWYEYVYEYSVSLIETLRIFFEKAFSAF